LRYPYDEGRVILMTWVALSLWRRSCYPYDVGCVILIT